MIILSIDVGIKNLAYCLLKKTKKTDILDWNIIDLANDNIETCKDCSKKANYTNKQYSVCKIHAKKRGFLRDQHKSIHNSTKKELLQMIHNKKQRLSNQYETFNKKQLLTLVKDNMFEKIKRVNCNKVNLIDIGKNIRTQFDKLFNHLTIDHILIENQISKIANRMKCIQGMIAQYFIMKQNYNIEFISSINKLKCLHSKKTSYQERKKKGIDYTRQYLIDNQSNMITHFNTHNKQDDLADSLLQGLWYLNK